MQREVPLTPTLLGQPIVGLRVLALGTCLVGPLVASAQRYGHKADHLLFGSENYSEVPIIETEGLDAAIVSLTFRHLIADAIGRPLGPGDMFHARPRSEEEHERVIQAFSSLVEKKVEMLHARISSIPTFFLSFFEPSFNYAGNLLHSPDVPSPQDFVRAVNKKMKKIVSGMTNFYYVEMNDILNFVGRMYLHDDINAVSTHASYLSGPDSELERSRIVPVTANFELDNFHMERDNFGDIFWRIIGDNIKILRQINSVKMIIVDLDDTLWRGVAAEENIAGWERIEGWPLGFVEALLHFKARGGLLAICSKNEELETRRRLKEIWKGAITEDDFVSMKINWHSKATNIAEILRETNILPDNVLFIDDNPREIDEVRSHFPTMRCLGGNHYDWRRIIMRSPETQVAFVSTESERRTELVRAILDRKASSSELQRDDWLRSLKLEQVAYIVAKSDHTYFSRAFELINKTNQFNTTGKRWQVSELEAFFGEGGVCVVTSLKDITVDNGIIGAALVKDGWIDQTVLSCRVFGLGAEISLGRVATKVALAQRGSAYGQIVDTGKNFASHKYFEQLGFEYKGDYFEGHTACAAPEWINLLEPRETR